MILRTLALGATALLSLTAPLAAQQVRKAALKTDIVVARETVTLGDLLDVSGAVADTPVFRAPPLGRNGTIQVARIMDAARAVGLDPTNSVAAAQVVVTRAARRISKTEVEEAARRALATRFGMENAEVSLTLDTGENALFVEPEAVGDLKVVDVFYDARARRVEAVFTIPSSRVLTAKPLRVTGAVVDMVEVPILTRAVARGEAVRPADIRMERRARAELPAGAIADANGLTGRISRTSLAAGQLLRDVDLVKQDLVEKNNLVTVVYEGPGLALSMRGKALEAGGIGDAVLVQNVQSKRQIQGTVVGPGRVSVSYSTPGPVAAAATNSVQ